METEVDAAVSVLDPSEAVKVVVFVVELTRGSRTRKYGVTRVFP